jgi:transcriptional regulator GlxA family with amidase domain
MKRQRDPRPPKPAAADIKDGIYPSPLQPSVADIDLKARIDPQTVNATCRKIGIILVPKFALISFSMIIEPLRSANLVTGKQLYDWVLLSGTGGEVMSNSGITLSTAPLREAGDLDFDLVVVCAGLDPEKYRDSKTESFLRRRLRHGGRLGAVSTGSFILARAGLLDDHRCTVHWNYKAGFQELYPALPISDELFVVDRQIVTCAGGTAVLDMMLHLIAQQHHEQLARSVSEQFIHGTTRQAQHHQRNDLAYRLGTSNSCVVEAVKLMEAHLDAPLSPVALAKQMKTSQRQLERLFRKYLGCTPTHYNQGLRMERARSLLRQTDRSVTEIALSCGFSSASYFSAVYQRYFGTLPRNDRRL